MQRNGKNAIKKIDKECIFVDMDFFKKVFVVFCTETP
jgi:hypothetical protein